MNFQFLSSFMNRCYCAFVSTTVLVSRYWDITYVLKK